MMIAELGGDGIKRIGSHQDIVNQKEIGMIAHNESHQS